MLIAFLIIALIVETIILFKTKIEVYVLAMWMAEREYPPPNKQDAERLAKKVTDKWFKRRWKN